MRPDREARYRALFAEHYADVLRFAARRVHPDHAEDVAAEAFLVAWRRFDEVPRRPGDARAWLFGVTRHCLLNDGRGRTRREALAVRVASAPADPVTREADAIEARVDL
ncbi:MAG TPA: sigma factor, partial [Kineosporiaceae bacterium]|nr:sigma factor [Kineosporiaceae bacterium]